MPSQSFVMGLLAMLICGGFFVVVVYLVTHPGQTMSEAGMLALGALITAFSNVLSFYFGSSVGSRKKDEQLTIYGAGECSGK